MSRDIYGKRLKIERQSRNISLRQLAELSGVNKTTIQRIESGEVSPSLETFDKILNAMSLCLKIESKRKNT
jgi:transcriptional regulator with XRE-family HTH domain